MRKGRRVIGLYLHAARVYPQAYPKRLERRLLQGPARPHDTRRRRPWPARELVGAQRKVGKSVETDRGVLEIHTDGLGARNCRS